MSTEYNLLEFKIPPADCGMRLDVFIADKLKPEGISRQRIKQLIQNGAVQLNNINCTTSKQKLHTDDLITLQLPIQTKGEISAEPGQLSIVYQDSDLLILNKPPYITVHPCPSCPQGTLVNILIHNFPELSSLPGLRPGIVHRLDKNTSGLLLIALKEQIRLQLSEAFAARQVHKKYLALVAGNLQEKSGRIDAPIGRSLKNRTRMAVVPHGKEAVTIYKVIYQGKNFALLEVTILTGRTHQIRVHLAHLGNPIWGDTLYGGPVFMEHHASVKQIPSRVKNAQKELDRCEIACRQMLHAWKLSFVHPHTGDKLNFTCPPPEDFNQALEKLLFEPVHIIITGLPGCGKSALLNMLSKLQVPVWSADENVAEEYKPHATGWQLLISHFGQKFLTEGKENIDKKLLFKTMCQSPKVHREVEELIHPLIAHNLDLFWQTGNNKQLLAAEVPLYLEAGLHKTKEQQYPSYWKKIFEEISESQAFAINPNIPDGKTIIIGVQCPRQIRYQRALCRGMPIDTTSVLDSWQWQEEKKMAACHIVVDNSGDMASLQEKAKDLYNFLKLAAEMRQKQTAAHIFQLLPDSHIK